MAINHGVLSEKGNGKDRAKSIPNLIRELLMEVVPRGGPHRRLIPRRLENPEEADYTNQRMHFCSAAAHSAKELIPQINATADLLRVLCNFDGFHTGHTCSDDLLFPVCLIAVVRSTALCREAWGIGAHGLVR